jgi:uncharacterized protein
MDEGRAGLRFLCDEMLRRLGRWLRASGYDTMIAEAGQADRQLVEQACREQRWLLTRDRKMAEFKQARDCVILMTGNDVPAQVEELGQRLPVDWLHAPFSRCLVCNAPLRTADPSRLGEVPEFSRDSLDELYECSGCHRLYWHGSHVRRMRAKLHRWKHRS